MKLTIKQLNEKKVFLNAVTALPVGKLSFQANVALRNLIKNISEATASANEVVEEKWEAARINNAMVGDKGELIITDGRYQYTPAGMLQMQKDQRAAAREYEAVTVDVTPSIIAEKDVPKDLDPAIISELKGLLFK